MAIVNIHWNYVRCVRGINLATFAKESAITKLDTTDPKLHPNVEPNCRGVYFRSVLTEELDFSDTLKGMRFEDVRRTRPEGGNALLFAPKPAGEKSIGVLRIMKPKRFNAPRGINVSTKSVNMVSRSKDYEVIVETTEFVLEDAQEQMQERFQLQETFGDFNVFFFGKRAEIFTYSGSLLNGCKDLQWRNQFLYNYENYLRGTRCVELKARAYFLYDDIIREGFILSASTAQNSIVDGVVKFNFTMLITDKRIMGYIPEGGRGLSLTLDRQGDTKQGITDFRFVRSEDPNLVGVAQGITTEAVASGGGADTLPYNFIVDESLGGGDPPEDLQKQMQNLTLAALDQVGTNDLVQISDESLDHDVLLGFIHDKKLGSQTQLIASGAKSLDVENFSGDQLVILLTGPSPTKTLSALRMKQAVAVALSFSSKNAPLIGEDLAHQLGELASYFSLNGNIRSIQKVDQTADFTSILSEGGAYILQAVRDDDLLDTLIDTITPISKFDKDALVNAAILSVKESAVPHFLQKDPDTVVADNSTIELYIAALALMRHPVTLNMLSAFSNFTGDVNGFESSVDYVRSQAFSKYAAVAAALPGDFSSTLELAVGSFKGSALKGLIEASFPGFGIDNIPLSEFTLLQSTVGTGTLASEESMKFLMQSSVYISGIVAEFFGPGAEPTSFDVLGGTVLDVKDLTAARTAYFVKAYADSLKPGTGKVADTIWLTSKALGDSFGPVAPDGSKYVTRPAGLTRPEKILFGPEKIVPSLGIPQKTVVAAGYPRIFAPDISSFNGNILLEAEVRKPGKTVKDAATTDPPWSATQSQLQAFKSASSFAAYPSPQSFAPSPITVNVALSTGKPITSVIKLEKYPAGRIYVGAGTGQRDYKLPTLANLQKSAVTIIGNFVSSNIAKISDAMSKATKSFIDNGIPSDVEQKPIKDELALSKLDSNPDIKILNEKIALVGATVDNFIDLLYVADREKDMAANVIKLKDLLGQAIAAANQDTDEDDGKGSNVADSDEATKNAICSKEK